ncbi:nSTAND1 domain-containing NTPase [Streptomyces sp. OR43]|uniref:nSTAND1 domain-containing NTPase n=1 Tax=Streptomyces sp. or43 TaxID=2478957 RepID=UPI0021CA457E|nr:trypsin-like peptidase domain-containing protein [Streptomyces sp. or43]
MAFLIAPDLVLTCAHVVAYALGYPRLQKVVARTSVTLDVPLVAELKGKTWTAEVEHFVPEREDESGDIAVLRLRDVIPGTRPIPMVEPDTAWDHAVGVVGFTGAQPGGIWSRGRPSGTNEQGWRQFSRLDSEEPRVKKGFSGSPVWDSQLGAAIGLIVVTQNDHEAPQTFMIRTSTLSAELPQLKEALQPDSPFRSLKAFGENDAEVFFGRDDDIANVSGALRGHHGAVTVYGPSGSGKSSLALAGVVPRMRKAGYDVLVVNAGAIGSLVAALATEMYEAFCFGPGGSTRVRNAGEVQEWLAQMGLADTLHRIRGAAGGKLLVVLDQAEALLARDPSDVAQAVEVLFPSGPPAAGLSVLVTLRADFMDAALKHPSLGPAVHAGVTLPLTPMSREQLRDVVSKPLEQIPGVRYEEGLVERILADAGDEPGRLPLLGFTLDKLWEGQQDGLLRFATYEKEGGVAGALARHAEEAWKLCIQKHDALQAQRLLTGLIRVLPGSSTPLRRRLTRQEAQQKRWDIAQWFTTDERRLLVVHGGPGEPESVELVHEALVEVWPALRDQARADSSFLAGRAELAHERERWANGNKAAGLLPGTVQLAALEERLKGREAELDDAEANFLLRARRLRQVRRNRLRAAWTAAAVVLALIVGLSTFLVYQQRVSTQREEESRSRLLANYSAEVAKSDPGQAALIAMGAYEISPTDEARNAMLRRYDQFKEAAWVLTGPEGKIRNVASSVDGTVTFATTDNGRATLFVRQAEGRTQQLQLSLDEMAFHPLVSRDGRRIAYLSAAGALVWHDVAVTATEPKDILGKPHSLRGAEFKEITEQVNSLIESENFMAFSPGAGHLATIAEGRLGLWDLRTGRHQNVPSRVPTQGGVSVWFGPDENTLVVRHTDSKTGAASLKAVESGTGKVRELAGNVDPKATNSPTALSGDGSVLVVCSQVARGDEVDAAYRALRVADGRVLNTYTYSGTNSDCGAIAVDEKGDRFAVNHHGVIVETRNARRVRHVMAPSSAVATGQLLGDEHQPLVLTVADGDISLAAVPLTPSDIDGSHIDVNSPRLIDGGKTLVARVRRWDKPDNSFTLALVDAASGLISSSVKRPQLIGAQDPDAENSLSVNDAGTLVADVVGPDKILIREIPSLRLVAEITTLTPPVDERGHAEPITLAFLRGGDELATLSGSRIEHWNARTGRHLSRPIDAHALPFGETPRSSSAEVGFRSDFALNSRPETGYAQVMIYGNQVLHAINLRTGRENRALRVPLGRDVERAFLDSSGHYAAAKTSGGMLELWWAAAGQRPHRVVGPLGPLGSNDNFTGEGYTFGFTANDGEFYVANGSTVRFQQLSNPSSFKTYDFAANQYFLAATKDGNTLLRTLSGGGFGGGNGENGRLDLIHLDPELWKRHLCDVVGHDLTQDERRGLPAGLPDRICPT